MAQLFKDRDRLKFTKQPVWCSDELWETVTEVMADDDLKQTFEFSKAEKKVLRKRKPILVSKWAEKHRILTMSSLPGVWKNSVTPYLVGIMDAAVLPYIREINICKTPQTGGSEAIHNIIGHAIDRAPGPVLYVYPDEKTSDENRTDRVLPMIKASPRLRSYFTKAEKDKAGSRIKLKHMPIYFGWGRSVSSIANKPIKIGIADEIDKPGFDGGKKETGVLELIDKRFITYRTSYKFFKLSTPTLENGLIWIELNRSEIIFDFFVKCPLCGAMQLMAFSSGKDKDGNYRPGRIVWEGGSDADPREVKTKNLAWYECAGCSGRWDEHKRNQAVQAGVWMARGTQLSLMTYLEYFRPSVIGFHIPAWISYFVSFGEIAAAFLWGLTDSIKMQDFKNAYCALPWILKKLTSSEEKVLEAKNDLPGGVAPSDTIALTCGIDVQKRGFWFVVRAWNQNKDSHLVQYGYLSTYEDVLTLVYKSHWQVQGRESGSNPIGIWRAAMDTGGNETENRDWSKTEEIYDFIKAHGRNTIFAVKGASRKQDTIIKRKTLGLKKKGVPIPGSIDLYHVDVSKLKRKFLENFAIEDDQGSDGDTLNQDQELEKMSLKKDVTLHADTGMDYAKQILSEEEREDRNGNKYWVQIRHDNHLLDCEIYAAAAADDFWAPSMIHTYYHFQQNKTRRVRSRGIDG